MLLDSFLLDLGESDVSSLNYSEIVKYLKMRSHARQSGYIYIFMSEHVLFYLRVLLYDINSMLYN